MSFDTLVLKPNQLNIAADILNRGGLVAIPTETVYGLGADAMNEVAVARIFEAKGRPADNPLIVHIADFDMLHNLVTEVPEKAKLLMDKFWPGPLTIIMNKKDTVPDIVSGGLKTVAVRMPQNKVAYDLIKLANIPIAAPSANTSGKPSPTKAQYVIDDMLGKIEAIIDGGSCAVGLESTVIDMTSEIPALLRPGGVTYEQLTSALGEVQQKFQVVEGEQPRSPGMKYKHYAPKAKVIVVRNDFEGIINDCLKENKKVGVMCYCDVTNNKNVILKKLGTTAEEYAEKLFSALREFDKLGADVILAQDVDDKGINLATKNRLYRAAAYNIYEKK